MSLWLVIPLLLGTTALSFGAGVRYAATRLLPMWLARMTTKELNDLAEATAREQESILGD